MSYAFENSVLVTGDSKGYVTPWVKGKAEKRAKAYDGACLIVYGDSKNVCYTGGKDGNLWSWTYSNGILSRTNDVINMQQFTKDKQNSGIVAFDMKPNG
jgi:hypothetical protein